MLFIFGMSFLLIVLGWKASFTKKSSGLVFYLLASIVIIVFWKHISGMVGVYFFVFYGVGYLLGIYVPVIMKYYSIKKKGLKNE